MKNYRQVFKLLLFVLGINISISILKLIVGSIIKSESIFADGLQSLTDGTSNIIGLIGIKIASKPADKDHPYGHRKFETLSSLFIGIMLIVVTYKIVSGAIQRFIHPYTPNITLMSLMMMVMILVINITVATIEYKMGKKYHSQILLSDSLNTRSDIFVTSSVLLTIILIKLGVPSIIDPISSLIVAAVIIYASIHILKSTIAILVDKVGIDPKIIKKIILSFPEVKDVDHIRSRGTDDYLFIDMHLKIDSSMNIFESHQLNHRIEDKLKAEINPNIQLIAHMEPSET